MRLLLGLVGLDVRANDHIRHGLALQHTNIHQMSGHERLVERHRDMTYRRRLGSGSGRGGVATFVGVLVAFGDTAARSRSALALPGRRAGGGLQVQ